MPVIAVINRKGGSGKSTLATHLSAWLARQNLAVMLGDVDRQQSARTWIKRRDVSLPTIVPWAMDQKNILRPPPGVTHVVLDTPGGLHGFELAKIVMSADAVVMPVCNSRFDRESAEACITELLALPRVISGRCKLGVVGMRLDARTHGAQTLSDWSDRLNVPFLGVLRETQMYVRSLDSGLTVFDLKSSTNQADLDQWESILNWLKPIAKLAILESSVPPLQDDLSQFQTNRPVKPSLAASLMPAQESMVHGNRLSLFNTPHASAPEMTKNSQTNSDSQQRNDASKNQERIPQLLKLVGLNRMLEKAA